MKDNQGGRRHLEADDWPKCRHWDGCWTIQGARKNWALGKYSSITHSSPLIFSFSDQAFGSSHACCSVSRSPRKVFGNQGKAKKTSRKSQKVEEQECSCTWPSQVRIYLCCSHSSVSIDVSDYIFTERWKETIRKLKGKETTSRRQLRRSLRNSAIIIKQARSWYVYLNFTVSLYSCAWIFRTKRPKILSVNSPPWSKRRKNASRQSGIMKTKSSDVRPRLRNRHLRTWAR